MFKEAKDDIKKLFALIDEYALSSAARDNALVRIKSIERDYHAGKINYSKYVKLLKNESGQNTEADAIKFYEDYPKLLLKDMQLLNAEIFYTFYEETPL